MLVLHPCVSLGAGAAAVGHFLLFGIRICSNQPWDFPQAAGCAKSDSQVRISVFRFSRSFILLPVLPRSHPVGLLLVPSKGPSSAGICRQDYTNSWVGILLIQGDLSCSSWNLIPGRFSIFCFLVLEQKRPFPSYPIISMLHLSMESWNDLCGKGP